MKIRSGNLSTLKGKLNITYHQSPRRKTRRIYCHTIDDRKHRTMKLYVFRVMRDTDYENSTLSSKGPHKQLNKIVDSFIVR